MSRIKVLFEHGNCGLTVAFTQSKLTAGVCPYCHEPLTPEEREEIRNGLEGKVADKVFVLLKKP